MRTVFDHTLGINVSVHQSGDGTQDHQAEKSSPGTSALAVDEDVVPLAEGYIGDKVARLMLKTTLSSIRAMTRSRPTPPNYMLSYNNKSQVEFTAYQTWVQVDSSLRFDFSWYWEIDGVAGPAFGFSGERTAMERIEIDVPGCLYTPNGNIDDYYWAGTRLCKRGGWRTIGADRYVRAILADPSLGFAAFEVFEHDGASGRVVTEVDTTEYLYLLRDTTFAETNGDAHYTSLSEAWLAHGKAVDITDDHGNTYPPFILSDMLPAKTAVTPPSDYTRYLVILTPEGVTKYRVADSQTFKGKWIPLMNTIPPQPTYAPRSGSMKLTPTLLTKILPRYGGKTVFELGEPDYDSVVAPLGAAGYTATKKDMSLRVFTALFGKTIGAYFVSRAPTLVKFFSVKKGAVTTVVEAENEAHALESIRVRSPSDWKTAHMAVGGGYLYVGSTSPAPNMTEDGKAPDGGWPDAPIIQRSALADKLSYAVPGYP